MLILRWISASLFGALIAAAPKYDTPLNIVHSCWTSGTGIRKLFYQPDIKKLKGLSLEAEMKQIEARV
jgi:hypothetical protein